MRHFVGGILLLISGILYCCPYVCSAIYLQNSNEYSNDLFKQGMDYVGGHFFRLSVLFFIAGVAYLIFAEIKSHKAEANK